MENEQIFSEPQLLEIWEQIGKKNLWIKKASDPPFNKSSFKKCHSLEELKKIFWQGNWCLGQAFYFGNICFINQVDGGDEWLTIKDDYAFESITFHNIIKSGEFENFINRLLKATKDECIRLKY